MAGGCSAVRVRGETAGLGMSLVDDLDGQWTRESGQGWILAANFMLECFKAIGR